jgi:isocitrate dehydrogenase kinase/phosphatase
MRAHRQTHPNRWQQCHRAVHDRQIATTEVHARVKDECLRQAMVANEKSNPEVATRFREHFDSLLTDEQDQVIAC